MSRVIHVGRPGGVFASIKISDENTRQLAAKKLVYDCGDGHDLHLEPDHDWTVDDVAAVLIAGMEGPEL